MPHEWYVAGSGGGKCRGKGMVGGDLQGLRGGDYVVERWGFEDLACGEKRSLQHWLEKKQKKENKNLSLLACQ